MTSSVSQDGRSEVLARAERASQAERTARDRPHVDKSGESAGQILAVSDVASRFRLLRDDEFLTLPEPRALVPGILYAGALVSLFGKSGSYKSFVALDLACSIGAGVPFCGRSVQQGSVVFVCAEGASGMRQRLAAWKQARGVSGSVNVHFMPSACYLTEPQDVRGLLAAVRSCRVNPVLIVLDTLNRNMKGSENDPGDMSRFIAGCDFLRGELGAAVLAVHHTGHDGKATNRGRGHSSWPAALDTEIQVTAKGWLVTLTCRKQKDGSEFSPIRLRMETTGDSLVPRLPAGMDPSMSPNASDVLSLFQSDSNVRMTAAEIAGKLGLPNSSVYDALKRLRRLDLLSRQGGRWRTTAYGRVAVSENSNFFQSRLQEPLPSFSNTGGEYLTPPVGNASAMLRSERQP
jgi:CRP-like cAMP-binding protein